MAGDNILCFDIGGTNIRYGLFDVENGYFKDFTIVSTERDKGKFFSDIRNIIKDEKCVNVSIAFPGNVDSNGKILFAPNLPFLTGENFFEQINMDNLNIKIENDANCAALGALKIFPEYNDVVTLTIGTGIGGGLIINKKLVKNSRSIGLEFGHVVVKTGGERCGCGNLGCLEAYSSSAGMVNRYNKLSDNEIMEFKELYHCYNEDDKTAEKVIMEGFFYLGVACSIFMNLFSPELFLFTGGISNVFNEFRSNFIKGFYLQTIKFLCDKTEFKVYNKKNLGVIGAASLFN